jgi:hypothetical protein
MRSVMQAQHRALVASLVRALRLTAYGARSSSARREILG